MFKLTYKSEVSGSRSNHRVQIFPPEYLGTYALLKDDAFGTFICLIMFQDKNRVVVPLVTPKGRGGGRTKNLMIKLKILQKSFLKSEIYLKTTVELKICSQFVKFRINSMICIGSALCLTNE
jgi:hypothetical protein